MKKVYLIGRINGSYRTQNIISILVKKNYVFYYDNGIDFFNQINNVLLRKMIKLIYLIFVFWVKIFFIYLSDVVFMTAMNNSKKWELKIAKLLKKKIITDYYISFYDTEVFDRKNIKEGTKIAKKLLKDDQRILSEATEVIFLNELEVKRYSELAKLKNLKYKIIPLCIDKKTEVKLPFFNKKNDYISICWWGTYIPLHGLEKIIKAMKTLKEHQIKFKFFVFGNDSIKSQEYKELAKKLDLEDYIKIRDDYTFSNGKLEEFLVENCDIVLGNFGDSEKAKTVLVNKIIDGIAMKAVVLNGESIGPSEFFNYEDDIWKTQNNPESIAEKIEEIYFCEKEVIMSRINNSYDIYNKIFSENAFEKKFISIIEE